ncbi:MAG: 16S rRNA (cytosine(967)-C(5))-methyltransferase RsmB [Eubacteriales bacterium]
MNVRQYALELLSRWEAEARYINLSLAHLPSGITEAERGLLTALLYGTVERKLTLDYYISALAGRVDLDPTTRNILRLGVYQILYMTATPPYAAVNETVKLARNKGEAGFVNAILRTALRAPEKLALPAREKNERRFLSLRYSVPQGTVRELQAVLGEQTEAFLRHSEETPPTTLFVNVLRIGREAYLERLQAAGIAAEATRHAPYGVRLLAPCPPSRLPGYREGDFFVQDEASQLALHALSPLPGSRLVDCCAAPGGKSFAAAIYMQNKGEVHSFDLHDSKLPLIVDGAARLGLSSIRVARHDSTRPQVPLEGSADYVICDVPCSGLGVLAKKPDLRYKSTETWEQLPELQYRILCAAAAYLRVGGALLYATCTILPRENQGVTDAFLAAHDGFEAVPFQVGGRDAPSGCLTLLPHRDGMDGFFMVKLRRVR